MIRFITPFFLAAYLAGVWGLVWFNLHVLDKGDPKFKTDVGFYFIIWTAFWLPAVIAAFVFLSRVRQRDWRLWRLAGIYLALILAGLEAAWLFDLEQWAILLLEQLILGFLFWRIQKRTDRIRHASPKVPLSGARV